VLKFEYLYKSGKYVHHSFAFGKNLNAYYYVNPATVISILRSAVLEFD